MDFLLMCQDNYLGKKLLLPELLDSMLYKLDMEGSTEK